MRIPYLLLAPILLSTAAFASSPSTTPSTAPATRPVSLDTISIPIELSPIDAKLPRIRDTLIFMEGKLISAHFTLRGVAPADYLADTDPDTSETRFTARQTNPDAGTLLWTSRWFSRAGPRQPFIGSLLHTRPDGSKVNYHWEEVPPADARVAAAQSAGTPQTTWHVRLTEVDAKTGKPIADPIEDHFIFDDRGRIRSKRFSPANTSAFVQVSPGNATDFYSATHDDGKGTTLSWQWSQLQFIKSLPSSGSFTHTTPTSTTYYRFEILTLKNP